MKIKREEIDKQFSTFLLIVDNSCPTLRWEIDNRLKHNIVKVLENLPSETTSEESLANKLLVSLRQRENVNKLAQDHLIAYLQESCYWATKEVHKRLSVLTPSLKWEDYFQMGNVYLAEPLKVLKNYQANLGGKIKNYAQSRLKDKIADGAYAQENKLRASDWGLLRKIGQRRRKELLSLVGLSPEKLHQHLLAWDCLEQIYTPTKEKITGKLPAPNDQKFSQILELYLSLANNYKPPLPRITLEQLRKIFDVCISAARKYANPEVISPPDYFDVASESDNGLASLEAQEDEQNLRQFTQSLTEAITSQAPELQLIWKLWKGLRLTQQEIVTVMGVNYPGYVTKQDQVSRKIEKMRKQLLEQLVREYPAVSKINTEIIAQLKAALDQYLDQYFEDYITEKLKETCQADDSFEELKLKLAAAVTSKLFLPQPDSVQSQVEQFIEAWLNQQKG